MHGIQGPKHLSISKMIKMSILTQNKKLRNDVHLGIITFLKLNAAFRF